jgi:hypothetical protein
MWSACSWWTFKVVGETLIDEPLVGEHFARLERSSIPYSEIVPRPVGRHQ